MNNMKDAPCPLTFLVKSTALVEVTISLRYDKGTTIETVQSWLYLFLNYNKHFHYSAAECFMKNYMLILMKKSGFYQSCRE